MWCYLARWCLGRSVLMQPWFWSRSCFFNTHPPPALKNPFGVLWDEKFLLACKFINPRFPCMARQPRWPPVGSSISCLLVFSKVLLHTKTLIQTPLHPCIHRRISRHPMSSALPSKYRICNFLSTADPATLGHGSYKKRWSLVLRALDLIFPVTHNSY